MLIKSGLLIVCVLASTVAGNSLLQEAGTSTQTTGAENTQSATTAASGQQVQGISVGTSRSGQTQAAQSSGGTSVNGPTATWQDDLAGLKSRTSYLNLNSGNEIDRKIRDAAQKMREAESSSDRAEAEDTLRKLLSEDYDTRLDEYGEYLDGLEKKLAEMRSKLERRRSAKSDMIDLRVKVLEAEADDLGWPSRVSGSRFPSTFTRPSGSGVGGASR